MRLAHLLARRRRQQRRGERVELRRAHAAAEVDAGDDIAPLIGAAHLCDAAVALVQLHEIVCLQAHVVELDEGQFLIAFEAQLHRIHRHHAIDGKMPADIAQEVDVVELGQPFCVVGHDGVRLAVAELQEFREDALDAVLVLLDRLDRQDLARLVLAGGIADARGAAAHQRHGLAAGLLQPGQHHDRQQRADVQRGRRAIEADIGDQLAGLGLRVEPLEVRALVQIAALDESGEEIGFRTEVGHGRFLLNGRGLGGAPPGGKPAGPPV